MTRSSGDEGSGAAAGQLTPLQVPALDGVRGLAILMVLLTHSTGALPSTGAGPWLAPLFAIGWAGVDLFFVLSGYLITRILISTRSASNYFASFYVRRLLRIAPLYYASLVLVAVVILVRDGGWLESRLPSLWPGLALHAVYLQNWPIFWEGPQSHLLAHFWSLAIEEQFYLVWPLVVRFSSPSRLLRICAIGLAVSVFLRVAVVMLYGGEAGAKFTLTRMDGLLLGAALATWTIDREVPRAALVASFAVPIAVFSVIGVVAPAEFLMPDVMMFTAGVAAAALFSGGLVACALRPGAVARQFENRGLMTLGVVSYGLYVMHYPFFVVSHVVLRPLLNVNLPLSLTVICALSGMCLVAAKLSFHYFETAFLRLKTMFAPAYRRAEPGDVLATLQKSAR